MTVDSGEVDSCQSTVDSEKSKKLLAVISYLLAVDCPLSTVDSSLPHGKNDLMNAMTDTIPDPPAARPDQTRKLVTPSVAARMRCS